MAMTVADLKDELASVRRHAEVARRAAQHRAQGAGLLVALLFVGLAAAAVGLLAGREEDPMLRLLREAPLDDEPLSARERRAVEAAMARVRKGETVPLTEDGSDPAVA